MIDLSIYTYRQLMQKMLEQIPASFDKRDMSPIPTALSPAAYALEGFYITLNAVQRSAFIQTAGGEALDKLAVIGGISRAPASPAVREGVFNTTVPLGSRFSTINGTESINFRVTAAGEEPLHYQLTAEEAGTIGNEYSGSILPITAVAGLKEARLSDILVPGDDAETDEELRARLLEALNNPAFGGNIASYRQYILAIDGVGAVQIYPTWQGGGTVKCSIIGADYLPASDVLLGQVQNAVDPPAASGLGLGLAPIGAHVTIGTAAAVTVNVAADITLAAGYTLNQVQPLVTAAVEAYLQGIRQSWGRVLSEYTMEYGANVYLSRVLAAIVGTLGIVNAANVRLNGGTADLFLTENGQLQELPVLGEVALSA